MIAHGITRTVLLVGPWAVKVPSARHRMIVRGWLGNRSEWIQRWRSDVNPPLVTLGYLVNVYRRADWTGAGCEGLPDGYDGDEAKPSSWGRFPSGWLLIDYDRAWQAPHGLVGRVYYGRQERMARRWADTG